MTFTHNQVASSPHWNTTTPRSRPKFAHDSARRCGYIQIICGFILIGTGIGMIISKASLHQVGFGIWIAMFCFISGGFGVEAAKTKKTCPINTTLVMSIFTAMFGFILFVMSCIGCNLDVTLQYCLFEYVKDDKERFIDCLERIEQIKKDNDGNLDELPTRPSQLEVSVALQAINIVIGMLLCVVPIIQSALSCRAVCCVQSQTGQAVTVINPQTGQPQTAFIYTSQLQPGATLYPVQGGTYPDQTGVNYYQQQYGGFYQPQNYGIPPPPPPSYEQAQGFSTAPQHPSY